MRLVASFLLLGAAFAAGAADIWRWKDENGVVHYSDTPVPGAERVVVSGSTPRAEETPAPPPAASEAPAAAPPPATVRYTRCAVTRPANDETFFAVDTVGASVVIEPDLQSGHRIEVLLNGAPHEQWPAEGTTFTFTGLYRGSYTLAVQVLDANGRTLCSGAVSSFHIRQPSVLSPQSPLRQQAPRN